MATAPGLSARAQTSERAHRAGVDIAVGGDSNPALAANPRDRARMDSTALAPAGTLAVDVWSRIALVDQETGSVHLSPYFTARGFSSGGAYVDLGTGALGALVRGPLSLEAGATLGGYAATVAVDNALYGDLSLATAAAIGPLRLRAEGYARFRSYTEDQLDGLFGARISVLADHGRVSWGAHLSLDQRRSNAPEARRTELGATVEANGVEGAWRWLAATTVYTRWFDTAQRDGREWLLRGRLERTLNARLGLYLAVQAGRARAVRGGEDALRYGRAAAEVGVSIRLHPIERTPDDESVTRVGPGRYRFAFHAPEATEVVLLADFLDWDAERGTLSPAGPGWFEGTFDVPAGHHRYRMLVDGVPVTPAARAYAEDGFGGRDAVLVVE
ncbi:MAG: hypothetical protein H6725_07000 [Sandaracinaceae bacterium]|nr:hypothetical protein [Sandaracinaceae bacterium]